VFLIILAVFKSDNLVFLDDGCSEGRLLCMRTRSSLIQGDVSTTASIIDARDAYNYPMQPRRSPFVHLRN